MITIRNRVFILAQVGLLMAKFRAVTEDIFTTSNGHTIVRLADRDGRRFVAIFDGARMFYCSGKIFGKAPGWIA